MSADNLAASQEVAGAAANARTVDLGMPVVIGERHGMFGATAGQAVEVAAERVEEIARAEP